MLLYSRSVEMFLASATLISAPVRRAEDSAARRRPNVLFLFSDDQRADTLAALGNTHV